MLDLIADKAVNEAAGALGDIVNEYINVTVVYPRLYFGGLWFIGRF
jgi:hypothetical protein